MVSFHRWTYLAVAVSLLALLLGTSPLFAENKIVRAVYKGGLELHEEPAGTVLADPSVCLPTGEAAARYDYKGQLVKTVAKARTRMAAHILDSKSSYYRGSIEVLDRYIALLSGTSERLKQFAGEAYVIPAVGLMKMAFAGTKFEGRCYKTPGGEFAGPDALGLLNASFGETDVFINESPEVQEILGEELPRKLQEFVALEKNTALSAQQKEEQFGKIAEEVMMRVGQFMLIHPDAAAKEFPRFFGPGGTRIKYTPTISTVSTGQKCVYVAEGALLGIDVKLGGIVYDITVATPSMTHTFRKCIPEGYALDALRDGLKERKGLFDKYRKDFVKRLAAVEKERASLEEKYPQYFGD